MSTEMNEDEAKALAYKMGDVISDLQTSMTKLVLGPELLDFLADVVRTKRVMQEIVDATHRSNWDKPDVNMAVISTIFELLPVIMPAWARKKIDG